MATQLELLVYITGLGISSESFPINIQRSMTVGYLKEYILEGNPNVLKGVDALRLALYQVQLKDDETLEQSALHAKNKKKLFPHNRLSELFPTDPPAEFVTILVEILGVGE
jgi:hypothetical protein